MKLIIHDNPLFVEEENYEHIGVFTAQPRDVIEAFGPAVTKWMQYFWVIEWCGIFYIMKHPRPGGDRFLIFGATGDWNSEVTDEISLVVREIYFGRKIREKEEEIVRKRLRSSQKGGEWRVQFDKNRSWKGKNKPKFFLLDSLRYAAVAKN